MFEQCIYGIAFLYHSEYMYIHNFTYTRGCPKNQRKPCAGTPIPLDLSPVFGGGILNIYQPVAKVYLPNPGFDACRPSFVWCCVPVPSGKRLHNYGKSPLLMGKSTNSMAIFNRKPLVYQRVYPINIPLNHYKIPLNHYKSHEKPL